MRSRNVPWLIVFALLVGCTGGGGASGAGSLLGVDDGDGDAGRLEPMGDGVDSEPDGSDADGADGSAGDGHDRDGSEGDGSVGDGGGGSSGPGDGADGGDGPGDGTDGDGQPAGDGDGDAGQPDAGVGAGPRDAGPATGDAGAQRPDGGPPGLDGSVGLDAGAGWDAGASALDAGPVVPSDAATAGLDAGPGLDAGSMPDGGAAPLDGGGAAQDAGGDPIGMDAGSGGGGGCVDPFMTGGALATGVKVVINEVVAYPLHDWSRSSAGGVGRFTSPPGSGKVDGTDQFVELYNAGTRTLDMRNWLITMKDGSPSTTKLGVTSGSYYIVSSGSALETWKPGAYLVIGNPGGFASTDAYYKLSTPCGALVDDVEVGGASSSRDYEGDGVNDGAPSVGQNSRAHGAFDESIARTSDGVDTGHDIDDFVAMFATPLAQNRNPAIDPADNVAPTILSSPSGTSVSTMASLSVGFDEMVDGNLAALGFLLRSPTTVLSLGVPDYRDFDRTVVLNPVGRLPFATNLTLFVDGVPDRAGNYAEAARFSFRTESAPANPAEVLISEVVCSAQQDWSGGSFTGSVGVEWPSSDDEWFELHNLRPGLSDLSSYVIGFYTGANTVTPARTTFTLGEAQALGAVVRVFGVGTHVGAMQQGDYVVVGNPPDTLVSDMVIELRNGAGQLVDMVEIGGNSADTDRGGNGINNGAPGAFKDGASTGLADESISRIADGDTGDDVLDFCYTPATMGAANAACTSQ